MFVHNLYKTVKREIQQHVSIMGKKPSLVQINRQEYDEIINFYNDRATLGLSIGGVSVIGLEAVDKGRFCILP